MLVSGSSLARAAGARACRIQFASLALLATVLLIMLPGKLDAGAVAAAALFAVILAIPELALYLLPPAVAFGSLVSVSVDGLNVGPTDLLVAALAVAWLVRRGPALLHAARAGPNALEQLRAQVGAYARQDRLRAALFGTLLAYLAVICLSLAVAPDKALALKEVVKWGEVTATLALALWLLHTPRQVRLLAWCAIAVGVAEALVGLAQWALPSDISESLRVFGTFAQPNPYAGYLNLALPLTLALAIFGENARERWLACGAGIVLLAALLLSSSRGGLLGLVAAVLTLVLTGVKKPRLAVPALAGAAALAAIAWFSHLIPAVLQARLLHALRLEDLALGGPVTAQNFSTMERLAHWAAGARMFVAHPVLGVGAGNYDTAYARYAVDLATWPDSLGHAHNYYINAAAESGMLGLLAFGAFTVCVLLAAGRLVRRTRDDQTTGDGRRDVTPFALAIGLFAVLVAFAVHNLTDDLFVHGMELQFVVYVACVVARRAKPPMAESPTGGMDPAIGGTPEAKADTR
jgi:O-antigen ligase